MMRLPRVSLAVLSVLATACPVYLAAAEPPVRVLIYTAAPAIGDFTPPDYRDRRDTVEDLRHWLPGKRKGVKFVVVDAPKEADVAIEVTGRARDPQLRDVLTVRAIFRCGDYASPVVEGRTTRGLWKTAAYELLVQFKQWAVDNRDLIAKSRSAGER